MVARNKTQHGVIGQTNPPTLERKNVLDTLDLKAPKQYLDVPRSNRGIDIRLAQAVARRNIVFDGIPIAYLCR